MKTKCLSLVCVFLCVLDRPNIETQSLTLVDNILCVFTHSSSCGLSIYSFVYLRGATQSFREFEYTAKPLALRTCAASCLLLYLSTISQPTCVFISAHVSEFWLFSLHCFHVCLLISKWWMLRSKEFALNFSSSSTKLQLEPNEC